MSLNLFRKNPFRKKLSRCVCCQQINKVESEERGINDEITRMEELNEVNSEITVERMIDKEDEVDSKELVIE